VKDRGHPCSHLWFAALALPSAISDIGVRRCHSRRSICIPRYRGSLIDRKRFRVISICASRHDVFSQETSMQSADSAGRSLTGIASVALYSTLAVIAVGAVPSDSARSAATTLHIFDPTLICGPRTTAARQARVAKRTQSGAVHPRSALR
jgi:hypothetical protein